MFWFSRGWIVHSWVAARCLLSIKIKRDAIFPWGTFGMPIVACTKINKCVRAPEKISFQKCNMGIKKCKIWCWFQIRWKSSKKTLAKKLSARKWHKNGVIDFYYCVQKFRYITSFVWILLHFSQWIWTQHWICVLWLSYRNCAKKMCLLLQFLLNLKPNVDETDEKKIYFINVA